MAKRKSAENSSGGGKISLSDVQRRMERLDRELVKMLQERTQLALRAAKARQQAGLPTTDLAEEYAGLVKLAEDSRGPLPERAVRAFLREVVSGARSLVRPVRVAYLGPKYSYSHQAALERFGSSAELAPVATVSAVFDEIARGQADYGLAPLENSTDGRIADTLSMFARQPLRICAEVPLRIHHFLLAKCKREEVREVFSKPQALSQCREWLARHLPAARAVEMASTTAAAQVAAEKAGAAAVASMQAGVNYGLDVLAANIEDNPDNLTRFAVIGNDEPRRTGRDKTALMFEAPHQPGALADAMAVFKRGRLNLTWIESFPLPGAPNQYLFFVELEGHRDELRVRKALAALERKTLRQVLLGSYPKAEPVS